MTKQDTVVISAAVTVSVTYCEADFETAEEYKQFYQDLTNESAKQLLIDNLDVDDTKDNIAQLGGVDIEVIPIER